MGVGERNGNGDSGVRGRGEKGRKSGGASFALPRCVALGKLLDLSVPVPSNTRNSHNSLVLLFVMLKGGDIYEVLRGTFGSTVSSSSS